MISIIPGDHRSKFSNLSNWTVQRKPEKKSGLQRDSNLWPPRYRCDALPTGIANENAAGLRRICKYQALVVQSLDNTIDWINLQPADSVVCFIDIYPRDSDLSCGLSVIQPLRNNCGLISQK